jgi:hypothetical protein
VGDEDKKRVDESYKTGVEREKQKTEGASSLPQGDQGAEESMPPEPGFQFFITTLAMQATIALGDAQNPADGKKEKSLPQAKFLIDTLGMLKEKTKNNLTPQENSMLEGILYELRMRYVQKNGG